MKIEVAEKKPGVHVVMLEGEVDMSTSPELRSNLHALFDGTAEHVIVDLSLVSYIDSSGIATLVEGLQLSRKRNVRFTLAGASKPVEGVFELAHLKDVFEIVPQLDELLE